MVLLQTIEKRFYECCSLLSVAALIESDHFQAATLRQRASKTEYFLNSRIKLVHSTKALDLSLCGSSQEINLTPDLAFVSGNRNETCQLQV